MDPLPKPAAALPPIRPPSRRAPGWAHLLLFLATLGTMTVSGSLLELLPAATGFDELLGRYRADPGLLLAGLPFALSLVAVLGSHEMGHYLACRRHGIPATLPFFIPGPPPFGTFGAVIRIRGVIPNRRALFDVAVAGPLAGWAVALPMLFIGLMLATPADPAAAPGFGIYGSPLIVSELLQPALGLELPLEVGNLYLAGWFGMLVTSINLFPVGQLDGGHIGYAISRRTHRTLTWVTLIGLGGWVTLLPLRWGIPSLYTVWFVVLLWMRDRHPPLRDEHTPLGGARTALAVLMAIIFAASFIPVPGFYIAP